MLRRLLLVNLLPVVFLTADVLVWWLATSQGFQRFGSVGVVVAALMFGLDRLWRDAARTRASGREDLFWAELSLIGISTLQWGYGDLFHCWTMGHGWQSCGV